MKPKTSQLIMVWLLPLIVIGGLFYPIIGLLVTGMIIFFVILSFFKQRYWCWFLCPRGAFLQMALTFVSAKRPGSWPGNGFAGSSSSP
jgi:ferredoxin-type protein NapH